jgi:hypothetical protein
MLAGRLEVAFLDRVEVLFPGDFLLIKTGGEDRHMARVLEGPVRLFIVDTE